MIALTWAIGLFNEISSYALKKRFDVSFSMRETKSTDTPLKTALLINPTWLINVAGVSISYMQK